MDECEEKKLMDKVMGDPNMEFVGKERVCDKDVENVLWKLGEEPKAETTESLSGKNVILDGEGKSMAEAMAKGEILPGIGDVSAHSVAP